jgi:protein-S-isoprenylcysteine O-methyltransferase Ste14
VARAFSLQSRDSSRLFFNARIETIDRVPAYAYLFLAAAWLLWFIPFPLNGWDSRPARRKDARARWGLLLQIVAYALLFATRFWLISPDNWRLGLSAVFFALAILLSSTAVRALGRHLRFDAALGPNHQLVSYGPYRILRHPIYSSMLCMLLGTGFLITPAPLLLVATFVFVVGTEVRVRIEDGLLESWFRDEFRRYRQSVSAYIPFVR